MQYICTYIAILLIGPKKIHFACSERSNNNLSIQSCSGAGSSLNVVLYFFISNVNLSANTVKLKERYDSPDSHLCSARCKSEQDRCLIGWMSNL